MKTIFVVIGVIILAAAVLGIISTFFHRATVSVTPHRYTATVDATFQTSADDPMLPYQNVTAEDTASKAVAASGSQHVQNSASGTVTIYNAYTTKSERLITNTRFQTADGLIFHIHTPVTVPGYTMKAGVKVPGQVDATVYADAAGDTYNVPASDFTLPGLTNPTEHSQIYAKSTSPMSGGFVGEQAVVDPTLRSQTVDALKADLQRSLTAKILATAPQGDVVFPDTIVITYTEKTDVSDGKGNATVAVVGSAKAPALPITALAKAIADSSNLSSASSLSIENPADLSVHVNSPDSIGSDTPLQLAVSGSAKLVAVFDPANLARDLAGKKTAEAQTVLPGYPGISDIVVKVYPFWRSDIPSDPANITVETATAGG